MRRITLCNAAAPLTVPPRGPALHTLSHHTAARPRAARTDVLVTSIPAAGMSAPDMLRAVHAALLVCRARVTTPGPCHVVVLYGVDARHARQVHDRLRPSWTATQARDAWILYPTLCADTVSRIGERGAAVPLGVALTPPGALTGLALLCVADHTALRHAASVIPRTCTALLVSTCSAADLLADTRAWSPRFEHAQPVLSVWHARGRTARHNLMWSSLAGQRRAAPAAVPACTVQDVISLAGAPCLAGHVRDAVTCRVVLAQ